MPTRLEPGVAEPLVNRLKKWASRLLLVLVLLGPIGFISGYFIAVPMLRIGLTLAAGFALMRCSRRWLENRHKALMRDQHKSLLEFLLARFTSGFNLEHAFTDAPQHLLQIHGRKSVFIRELDSLAKHLQSGGFLPDQLLAASSRIDCIATRIFFCGLASLQKTGARLNAYIRTHLNMILEQQQLLQNVKAEQAQRRAEAAILCGMPYLMAFLFSQTLTSHASVIPLARAAMMTAFLLAVTSLCMTFQILTESNPKTLRLPLALSTNPPGKRQSTASLSPFYFRVLPSGYALQLHDALDTVALAAQKPASEIRRSFFRQKIYLLSLALPVAVLLGFLLLRFWGILVPVFFCLAHDRKFMYWAKEYRQNCQREYPVFIRVLSALMQVDLSAHQALRIAIDVFLRQNLKRPLFQPIFLRELQRIEKRFEMAWSADMILQELADRCPVPEGRSALSLMAQYEHAGSTHILHLIDLQASACWSQQKNSLRAHANMQSLKLLAPMIMNLIAVMIVALVPAVSSLAVL